MALVQPPEAQAFIQRVVALPKGPGALLDPVLKPSLDDETHLRRLFATEKTHARLSNPYVGLVDVFEAPVDIRTTRARIVKDDTDLSAQYVMPLSKANRRAEGSPSMVADLDEFRKNWGVFSEGSLSQLLDWNNVVAAGGSVLACLTPLSDAAKVSKRSMRKYYHSVAYPTSDVDLFLWGLTPDQAEVKISKIYEAVRDSVPWDVTCVRTKHTVSIHSQYPYRSVQIVLRLYSSPAEILAGFDIDAPCCAYDGNRVYANPRAIVAMMRQCNTVDMTRRSPSYEVRLAKYSARAFEVYVPSLARTAIDPTIFERSIVRITGLARLLVLEKLTNTDERFAFLESRRTLRGRPNPLSRYSRRSKRKYKGDLKAEGTALGGLEMNDYDVASLHIPYGPGWDARRIDKLVYQTDLGMNSTFNPKNKGRRLHRHPAFFGTIQECIEDCCEHCPAPIDEDERKLQAEEDEGYIRGRISFMQEDPGRQSLSGSFNPIDVGEWSAQVYIGPTERFFAAIAADDRAGVVRMIAEGQDVNQRDHVGRAPLHVAIVCKVADIACALVDAGARMTARLVDGRTALHLAAHYDVFPVVRKLLERSAVNAEQAAKDVDAEETDEAAAAETERDRASSEDDWSSEDDDMAGSDEDDGDSEGSGNEGSKPPKSKAAGGQSEPQSNVGDLPEDEADLPDVLDINLADWDMSFTALAHAIVFGSLPIVDALLDAGADVKLVSQTKGSSHAVVPLMLTVLSEDDERTCKIATRLIQAGASCSAADQAMRTVFHHAVVANRPNLISTFLRCDPNAKAALNYPMVSYSGAIAPLVTAIGLGNYSAVAAMLAHGCEMVPAEEEVQRAFAASMHRFSYDQQNNHPVETALGRHDDIVRLLVDLGADINVGVKKALAANSSSEDRRTLVDWVQFALAALKIQIAKLDDALNPPESLPQTLPGWKGFLATHFANAKMKMFKAKNASKAYMPEGTWQEIQRAKWIDIRDYYSDMEKFLLERGAKPWSAVYPDSVSTARDAVVDRFSGRAFGLNPSDNQAKYYRMRGGYGNQDAVLAFQDALYDELYEACFTGANEKIQELCLPAEKPKKDVTLLQIAVMVADPDGSRYAHTGVTPLFAAVAGRHWDTARLIVAIASAQYKPSAQSGSGRFNTSDISFDDDSDNESDASDDSDDTVEQDAINFVDIANRSSTVECDVHPRQILDQRTCDLLHQTIADDDFEAFTNILNIYKHSPKHVEIPSSTLASIVSYDRADMLDEFIRRTGQGIKIQSPAQNEEDDVPVVNDKNRVYLGLSVHGKKRTDLAKRNDPDAVHADERAEVPVVWSAVLNGKFAILDYLLGDRPLAAYKFYASSNNTDNARLLQRTSDLSKVLPEWLGWTMTPLGESPLTPALASLKLVNVKYLFDKAPRLMASSLHERIKFLGINHLMFAVLTRCGPDIIDFLLAKSISPAEKDQTRGWNIFHYMCDKNYPELLKHLLYKLPRDVVEALLVQQSKGRLNTPLHLCAKHGFIAVVRLIVEFSKSSVLIRDVDGSIPLHNAVCSGFAEIVQVLIDAGPVGLRMENGVGEAALEIATLQDLIKRNESLQTRNSRGSGTFELHNAPTDSPARIDIERLDVELPKFRAALKALVGDGIVKPGSKMAADMSAFAEHMVGKLSAAKAAKAARDVVVVWGPERCDTAKTLANVRAALSAVDGRRQLVHLVDVQTSVQGSLARTLDPPEPAVPSWRRRSLRVRDLLREGGLEPEEDLEEKALRSSYAYIFAPVGPDTL
ncbi:ankyrin repeat protein [Mycena belliarum]|uniref:Ankyrin repeat protein n=1 Tax=Mycena belliarum TaxID=1033014 RepID=A0AAD6XHS1_9AGAR|nr:ankyrin repeat protein [Mycena belliae]